MQYRHIRARLVALAAAAAAFLSACGGGGGGGTLATPSATAGAKSIVTTGVVTGFGSVYVNGVRYDTSGAQFEIEGRPGTQAELKVGDVVQLKGRRGGNGTATAERIVHRNSVLGPIASIDTTTNRIVVLGQTVLVTASTSFDDSISPASLAGLEVDDVIEVSGLPNSSAQIEATRIEKAAAGATWEVVGRIAAFDGMKKQFRMNDLVVDYANATLDDFAATGPKDGDVVEAKGTSLGSAGELRATKVEFLGNKDMRPDASGEVEIEGFVTRFVSATDFDVAGRPVTTTGATVYEGGTAADLRADARVEVEGALDANGVLVAAKVQFKRQANVRIEAAIESIDATASTFKVLGVEVAVDASTRVEDKGASGSQFFRFADLRAGDPVAVRAIENPAGSGKLLALRLERLKELRATRLRGAVKSVARPNFTILTVVVATTDATTFERHEDVKLTADQFFGLANLVGSIVDVTGTQNGTVYTATKVEVGGEDD